MLQKQKAIGAALIVILIVFPKIPALADNRDRTIKVMTYNMYTGAEFTDIFGAQTQAELVAEVAEAFTDTQAGNVPERIDEIADQIASGSPHVVGLQEVALWRFGLPQDPAPATAVAYDFLAILLDRLDARGRHYVPVAIQTNLDAELTGVFGPELALDIRFTDRVVILARADISTSELMIVSTGGGNFSAKLPVTVLGTTIDILRGWTSVDIRHRGKTYRFVNAHLESFHEQVQLVQAVELLQGPASTDGPVILAGDFNSDAEAGGTVYGMISSAGFADAWDATSPSLRGYTWPLSGEIPNVIMSPTQRLDLILARGAVRTSMVDIVGEDPIVDLTPSGFRPSDHAAVVASFVLEP